MMMNFIDLSAASEEERRLIREILSDTSIVNIATPPQLRPINSTVSNATTLIATAPKTTTSKHLNASSGSNVPTTITTTTSSSSSSTTNTTTTTTITTTLDIKQQHQQFHQQQQHQNYQHNIGNKPAQQQHHQQKHNLPSIPSSNTVEASQQPILNSTVSAGASVSTTTPTTNLNTQTSTSTTANNQQDNFNKLATKSQQTLPLSTNPNTPTNAHQLQQHHHHHHHHHHNLHHHPQQPINGLDVNIDSEVVDTNKSVQQQKGANISSETNAPSTINVQNGQQQPFQQQHQQPQQHQPMNNSQLRQQHANGQRQSFKNSPNQHMNFSNNGHSGNSSNTNLMGPNTVSSLNHRNSYSNQRKNIHNNSGNSSNSISGNSGNNNNNNINSRNTKLSSSNNPVSGVNSSQQHYPQQYTSPLPSNTSPSTQYHNINVNNINNHSANALSSQLNQQRTTNEHGPDRLRSGGMSNHINSSDDINIVVTSSSGIATLTPNLDQHHSSTMPLTAYNHPATHMHHQVPSVMPTAKLDPKNNNLKSQTYHPQDTSNTNIQNNTSGAQTVPPSAQMPQLAGDMNSVIGMDMTSTQPPGYAIPPHVAAFGPPAHHVYGGAPIFQPYHYLIPYNIPLCPYVLPTNSVVPPRQQVPPQPNQSPNSSNAINSHQRHSTQHHQGHEQYHNLNNNNNQSNLHQTNKDEKTLSKDPNLSHQSQNLKKNSSEKEVSEGSKQVSNATAAIKTTQNNANLQNDNQSPQQHQQKSDKHKKLQQESERSLGTENVQPDVKANSVEQAGGNIDKQNKSVPNVKPSSVSRNNNSSIVAKYKSVVPGMRGDKSESQQQLKHEIDLQQTNYSNSVRNQHTHKNVNSDINRDKNERYQDSSNSAVTGKSTVEESVKISSDEGFETQSSLDVSKQSHDNSIPTSEQSKLSSVENCKSSLEQKTRDLSDLNNVKSNEVPQKATGVWGAASSKSWADLFKRESCALLGSSVNGEIEHNISGSENSDEEIRAQRSNSIKIDSANKTKSLTNSSKEQRSKEAAKRALDEMAPKLAHKIASLNLKHALPYLKPRGFMNKGNGCYINATLQALIACPPFYNLMKEIGDLRGYRRENSCTPILDSFAEFFLNFPPLDSGKKNKQSSSQDQKMHINYLQAEAIEPKCIYNALGQIKSECLKGAQEDAEEFLSSVLNGLHEEMIGLSEVLSTQDPNARNEHTSDADDSHEDVANDDNLWRQRIGPKNRSLPIRTEKVVNTPIQEIFGGLLFSIRTAGKESCGHQSPFFDLQLDISGDNVKSVQDAIKSFTAPEIIHDFYCSKTKQKLDVQRRTSFEHLPPILILHLKQFVYTQDHGLKKLIKKIDYPIDFELPENCLHEKNSTDKNSPTSRSYKLLAVVYHEGKEAVKGHYLTDVYHIGSSQWIRCDDSNLKPVSSPRIETPDSSRTPYLLFYRRLNTLRAQTGNHDSKKKS